MATDLVNIAIHQDVCTEKNVYNYAFFILAFAANPSLLR